MHTIFTKSNCRYCTTAKSWLKSNNILFQEQSLDDPEIKELFKQAYPDIRSVPVVFDEQDNLTIAWKNANII